MNAVKATTVLHCIRLFLVILPTIHHTKLAIYNKQMGSTLKNLKVCVLVSVTFACLAMCNPLFAQVSQNDIVNLTKQLDERENSLQNCKFTWEVSETANRPAMSKAEHDDIAKNYTANAERVIIESHTKDPIEMEKTRASERRNIEEETKKIDGKSIWKIVIARNKDLTDVSGTMITPDSNIHSTSHQIYGNKWAIFYDIEQHTKDGSPVAPRNPFVLGTATNAIYSDVNPYPTFDISSIEYAMLAGFNPLKTNRGAWKYNSNNQVNSIIIKNSVGTDSDAHSELNGLFLDPLHGYFPYQFTNRTLYSGFSAISSSEYQKSNGIWIVSHIRKVRKYGTGVYTRTYRLVKIEKADNFGISFPERIAKRNIPIADYRLFGEDLPFATLMQGLSSGDPSKKVLYQWTGQVPSFDELKKLAEKQHASAQNRDLSRPWMFIPGVLLIATGIFLKLRKSRKEKEAATPTPKSK